MNYPPRILRTEDARYYCGMGKELFDREIRPMLTPIKIGDRGIGFDRVDIDDAITHYKESNSLGKAEKLPCLRSVGSTGTQKPEKASSESRLEERNFRNALRQLREKKRKPSTTG